MSVAPITPKEAQRQHLTEVIPDEVYEVVNKILAERYSDSNIIIYREEVISRAVEQMRLDGISVSPKDFSTCHWLNFEPAYREAGWRVTYCSPDRDERFKSHWEFHRNQE